MLRKKYYWLAGVVVLLVLVFVLGRVLRWPDGTAGALPPSVEQGDRTSGQAKADSKSDKRKDRAENDERNRLRMAELMAQAKVMELEELNRVREPHLYTLDVQGNLFPQLAESLDLTKEEMENLTGVIRSMREEEKESFISRARLVKNDRSGGDGSVKYTVRAKEDLGEGSKEQWAERIKGAIGEEKGARFVSVSSGFDFYGDFGKYDIDIEYYQKDGEKYVRYKYIVAADGKLSGTGGGPLKDVNYTKWDLFPAGK